MLLCRNSRTIIAAMRHGKSVVNFLDDSLRVGKLQRYPSGFNNIEGRLWPVLSDSLAMAPQILRTFLELIPPCSDKEPEAADYGIESCYGHRIDHWGTGPFLRHMQTAVAALAEVVPGARLGIHSALQERPFGALDQVEPHLRGDVDPQLVQMEAMNWWTATPSNGVSHDQFALMFRNFWVDEASRVAKRGLYFTSNGTILCLRYLAECLCPGDLAKKVVEPWEKVPNLGILCYANFPFDGSGEVTPYLSYRMAVYPDSNGQIAVIPQHPIPGFELSDQPDYWESGNQRLLPWPRLYSLKRLQDEIDEHYPDRFFDRGTGQPLNL